MAWDEKNLVVMTLLDGRQVVAETELVAMVSLRIGDRFLGLGPAQHVFEVTGSPQWAARARGQGRGWLWVRDLSMTDAQARSGKYRHDGEPDTDPRDCGYSPSYLPGTRVKKVLRLISGR